LRYLATLAAAISLALTGCTLGRRPPATPTGPIHATAIPAASPTALPFDTPRPMTTNGPCANQSEFVADVTIPDGTQVEPGTPLDKRWLVRNNGSCDWGPGYTLVHISGPGMEAEEVSGLYPARVGAEVEIQLPLTAPSEPGEYTSTWQMRDAQAQPFGDVLFITIVVTEAP
jgi:hypothetical protein